MEISGRCGNPAVLFFALRTYASISGHISANLWHFEPFACLFFALICHLNLFALPFLLFPLFLFLYTLFSQKFLKSHFFTQIFRFFFRIEFWVAFYLEKFFLCIFFPANSFFCEIEFNFFAEKWEKNVKKCCFLRKKILGKNCPYCEKNANYESLEKNS